MSEKTENKVEDGGERATETRDADSTNMTDQKEEKESDLQGGQLDRTTNDLHSEQNINVPLRMEPSSYDIEGSGQQQTQEPDEPQAQPVGPPPNQLTESREKHDTFSALKHGPEEQSPRLESTETQEQSTSQKISPGGNPNQEQSAGQQPTQQEGPQGTEELDQQEEEESTPQITETVPQSAGQQPTQQEGPQETEELDQQEEEEATPHITQTVPQHTNDDPIDPEKNDLLHNNETGSQKDEIKVNNQTDKFQSEATSTLTSTQEGETPPVSDDRHGPKNIVDEQINENDEGKSNQPAEQNITNETSTDPKSNTTEERASYESPEVSDKSSLDLPFHKPSEIPEIINDESLKSENIGKPISGLSSPTTDEPTFGFPYDQVDETPNVSDPAIELEDQKQKKSSRDKTDSKLDESSVPVTEQQEENEIEEFQERSKELGQVVFIEKSDQPAIRDLLKNCQSYQMEFPIVENLKAANDEYEYLLKKEKDTGCKKHKSKHPPSELSFVNDTERKQAPLLYAVIADVSKKVPNYSRWREAVSEFINLTTISQPEPHTDKKKRTKSLSDYQTKLPVQPAKSYRNNIEKLLDQEWGPKRAPGSSVLHDYRHLFTCESVLRSTFPEADIFGLVDSTIRGPEDVPQELRHKALYHFLLSIKSKTYGVEPSDAWRDFGRLVLAEKQLELAKKAQGPDLHQNIIVKRLDFYKMQNELKEKTEEVEELSTRLSKFASQQLTEGNPNIADLSDTHRPTRLGEMYSQLFDDEWSEAFEAFKPKTEDEDDDIFPDTLYILQDLLTRIFEFCKDQSKGQKTYIEESFAMAIGLTEPKVFKKEDAAKETDNTIAAEDAPKLDEKEQAGSLGDTGSFTDKINEEEQVKESQKDTGGKGESSEQLSTPQPKEAENVEKESSNKLEPDKSGKDLSMDTNTNDMQETPSNGTPIDSGGESSKTLETDKENTIPPTDKAENGEDKHVDDAKQNMTSSEQKESEGTDVSRNNGNNRNNNEDRGTQINEQEDHNQQTSKDTVGEEPSNQTTNARSPEKIEEGKENTEQSDSSQKDQAQVSGGEDKMSESKDYRKNIVYPTIERHARDFRKAAASTSAKTKSKLFIATGLPALIADETVRADVRVLTYVRKCVELCWYMCMQDPPMVIVSPKRGQLVDKALFSFHGRRGKIVEVCVWPALLLHEEGPLVCKGYVLPEERNRNR